MVTVKATVSPAAGRCTDGTSDTDSAGSTIRTSGAASVTVVDAEAKVARLRWNAPCTDPATLSATAVYRIVRV